jgi:hypothetical protein
MKTLFEMAPLIVALSLRTRKKTLTKAIGPLAMSKRKTCGRYVEEEHENGGNEGCRDRRSERNPHRFPEVRMCAKVEDALSSTLLALYTAIVQFAYLERIEVGLRVKASFTTA